MSDDLRQRLRAAAPPPSADIPISMLRAEVTRRRRRARLVAATAMLIVAAAGGIIGVTAATGTGHDSGTASISAEPAPSPRTAKSPQISVSPDSGLVDGQAVRVSGSGFAPAAQLAIVTCASEAQQAVDKQATCDTANVLRVTADQRGTVTTTYTIRQRIDTARGGAVDCASSAGRCRIGVGAIGTHDGAASPLSFKHTPLPSPSTAPASSPAMGGQTLSLVSGALADQSAIQLHGTGFTPNQAVEIRQCPQNTDCGGLVPNRTVTADTEGNFTAWVTLHNTVAVQGGGSLSCDQSCFFVAGGLPATDNHTAVTAPFNLAPEVSGVGNVCSSAQLVPSYGARDSGEIGEQSAVVNVRNTSGTTCWLYGYPTVQLINSGAVLPFMSGIGGDYVSDHPGLVQLNPGATAHFEIAKHGCDGPAGPPFTTIDFSLPNSNVWFQLPLPSDRTDHMQYCQAVGETNAQARKDAGNALQIGPIVKGNSGS